MRFETKAVASASGQISSRAHPQPQQPIVMPPLPDNFMGGKISPLNQATNGSWKHIGRPTISRCTFLPFLSQRKSAGRKVFALGGGGISDNFKHFLEKHPGMSYEEALHKLKEEQKAKARHRQGPKLH